MFGKSWILVFFPMFLFGNYMGNIVTPFIQGSVSRDPFFAISEGYVYDVIYRQDLFDKYNDKKEFRVYSNFNIFSLSIMRRLELYTLLGSSYESLGWVESLLSGVSTPGGKRTQKKKYLSCALGMKVILLQFSRILFGINVQYFSLPCVHYIKETLENISTYFLEDMCLFDSNNYDIQYNEWNFSFGLTAMIYYFMPYIAIGYKISHFEATTYQNVLAVYDNMTRWGLIAGSSFNVGVLHLNAEIRRSSETSIGFQVSSSF